MTRPEPNEYMPYFEKYISLAATYPDVRLLLHELADSTFHLFANLPAGKEDYAYAKDKWTVKEMLGHMIDTERVFAYRLLCISRRDKGNFPGFEQDDYVANSTYADQNITGLATEFRTLRQANIYLIDALTDQQLQIIGSANGNMVSVKALVYMLAGHELYHLNLLREKYLS